MHTNSISKWQHTHVFGQDQVRSGERRTLIVVIITGLMMVAEILVGIFYGSMALLADGFHMATHAGALTISALAYLYARRHAHDGRFAFGTMHAWVRSCVEDEARAALLLHQPRPGGGGSAATVV